MFNRGKARFELTALAAIIFACAVAMPAQQAQYPKATDLPNPYRLVAGWPTLPQSMNAGHWGEVIRVSVDRKGHIWVFHRCFNTLPAGHASCIGRGESNPPILEFDASGKLLRSFGVGLFAYAHGLECTPKMRHEVKGRSTSNGDEVWTWPGACTVAS